VAVCAGNRRSPDVGRRSSHCEITDASKHPSSASSPPSSPSAFWRRLSFPSFWRHGLCSRWTPFAGISQCTARHSVWRLRVDQKYRGASAISVALLPAMPRPEGPDPVVEGQATARPEDCASCYLREEEAIGSISSQYQRCPSHSLSNQRCMTRAIRSISLF